MKYSESQALVKMAAYCSKAERAEADVRRKLTLWEVENEPMERIIDRLKKENYLNEERFCRSFIKDKMLFNKWGRTKIVFELKRKQISEQVINISFSEFEVAHFEESLLKILTTKAKSVKAKDDYDKKNKLIRFALGRGYSYEQILRCLSKILDTNNDEDYFDSFS
ncbi:regulatory protein RecX [Dysgonomonas macrotermitis]|uniref:Regulatory protein RecX n=1 Tax=Dysgonomonas macrotermitis TaxID=1346286 RepID=A0A1M5CDM2_9BACT|nr:regulatory protein RecX [Dysgonomonas macrotermitis]SHF52838.1 regulatory protein [Dysgonomonas macrotermitis]